MDRLTLPPFSYRTTIAADKTYIFGLLRKQYVRLTPEEWVRQHMIHYLTHHLQYPASLMSAERTINAHHNRADILLYNKKGEPIVLVECKSAQNKLTRQVIAQVMRYNHGQIPFIICTNGKKHFCFQKEHSSDTYRLLKEIPTFAQIIATLTDE